MSPLDRQITLELEYLELKISLGLVRDQRLWKDSVININRRDLVFITSIKSSGRQPDCLCKTILTLQQ